MSKHEEFEAVAIIAARSEERLSRLGRSAFRRMGLKKAFDAVNREMDVLGLAHELSVA